MSVQPFSNLGMADDFFSVHLHTFSKTSGTNAEPVWILKPTNSAVQDRYKFYKRCFAVVDFVDIKAHDNFRTGDAIAVRDTMNSQPNSYDSLNGYNNIIYMTRGIDSADATIASTNPTPVPQQTSGTDNLGYTNVNHYMSFTGATKLIPQGVGFPYEKLSPFGEQRLVVTDATNNTPIDCGYWGIKITYYFYKE